MTLPLSGVFCASATPVDDALAPNLAAFTAQCRWLLAEGCDGIALLGTTGEANSFSSAERRQILEAALSAGIAPSRLLPGTGLANIPETVDLTRHALSCGLYGVGFGVRVAVELHRPDLGAVRVDVGGALAAAGHFGALG